MKVLVTGGSGFTGSRLAKSLLRSGTDVRLLIRNDASVKRLKGQGYEIVKGDIRDQSAVNRAVKGVKKVFNIAAVFRTAGIADNVYRDVHVTGTENLLKASLECGVERFIHCSTVGVHGHIDNPPADEGYPFNPGDIYQQTKLEGEMKAVQFGKDTGLAVTVIRPSAIYGPGDMRLYKLFKLSSRKIVVILGLGTIYYHMVYIDDLINAFHLASENDNAVGEIFIIGGARYVTLNELIDTIASTYNINAKKIHLPVTPFQWLGSICERLCIPFNLNPPIYRRRVDFFIKSRAFNIEKAINMLGYKPGVDLREGIVRTAAWYSEQGLT